MYSILPKTTILQPAPGYNTEIEIRPAPQLLLHTQNPDGFVDIFNPLTGVSDVSNLFPGRDTQLLYGEAFNHLGVPVNTSVLHSATVSLPPIAGSGAFYFQTPGQYISCGSQPRLQGFSEFCFTCWLRTDAVSFDTVTLFDSGSIKIQIVRTYANGENVTDDVVLTVRTEESTEPIVYNAAISNYSLVPFFMGVSWRRSDSIATYVFKKITAGLYTEVTPTIYSGSGSLNGAPTKITSDPVLIGFDQDKTYIFRDLLLDELHILDTDWSSLSEEEKTVLTTPNEINQTSGFMDLSTASLLHFTFADEEASDIVSNKTTALCSSFGDMVDYNTDSPTVLDLSETIYSVPGSPWSKTAGLHPFYFAKKKAYNHNTAIRVTNLPSLGTSFSLAFWISPEHLNTTYSWDKGDSLDPRSVITASEATNFYASDRCIVTKKKYDGKIDFDVTLVEMRPNRHTGVLRFRVFGKNSLKYLKMKSAPIIFHAGATPSVPVWNHIVLNFSEYSAAQNPYTKISFFLNGVLQRVGVTKHGGYKTFEEKSKSLWIGMEPEESNFFRGYMTDFRLLNRTVTYPEVMVLYSDGVGTPDVVGEGSNLLTKSLLYLKMNEDASNNRVYDSSGRIKV